MGVSVDSGGGRGKGMNFELNLVPFIDLLSVCITFLLATAVWTQIMTMQVDQAISAPPTELQEVPPEPPTPPLTVHLRADGAWIGRSVKDCADALKFPNLCNYPLKDDLEDADKDKNLKEYDWVAIRAALDTDKAALFPACDPKVKGDCTSKYEEEVQTVIVTDDGVFYEHMIAALDLTREIGYEKTLLGGGPAQASAIPGAPQ